MLVVYRILYTCGLVYVDHWAPPSCPTNKPTHVVNHLRLSRNYNIHGMLTLLGNGDCCGYKFRVKSRKHEVLLAIYTKFRDAIKHITKNVYAPYIVKQRVMHDCAI